MEVWRFESSRISIFENSKVRSLRTRENLKVWRFESSKISRHFRKFECRINFRFNVAHCAHWSAGRRILQQTGERHRPCCQWRAPRGTPEACQLNQHYTTPRRLQVITHTSIYTLNLTLETIFNSIWNRNWNLATCQCDIFLIKFHIVQVSSIYTEQHNWTNNESKNSKVCKFQNSNTRNLSTI